jgi:predicted CopG family antitoxin
MTAVDVTSQNIEAIEYAANLLQGFRDTGGMGKISAWLDDLAEEFDLALSENRGMDPRRVRSAVQALIDTAQFPPNNRPVAHPYDQGLGRIPFETPLFRYEIKDGRPTDVDGAVRNAFTVSAVAARFDLHTYRNDERSRNTTKPRLMSAIDIVAEAYKKLEKSHTHLKIGQETYSGVRNSYARGLKLGNFETDGRALGTSEKELAIKMATTEEE